MKKWYGMLALLTALALSIGVASAEGNHGDKKAEGRGGSACCCCSPSCPR
jgi:hypothetical protein